MNFDQTDALVSFALGIIALLGAIGGWLRWVRPRWRRFTGQVRAGRDSLIGREAIVDTITGREIAPAIPGIGVRMESVEHIVERIATVIEGQQEQNLRLDDHEVRINNLEDQTVERIATKAESAAAWRAVEKIAESSPPPPLPADEPELD